MGAREKKRRTSRDSASARKGVLAPRPAASYTSLNYSYGAAAGAAGEPNPEPASYDTSSGGEYVTAQDQVARRDKVGQGALRKRKRQATPRNERGLHAGFVGSSGETSDESRSDDSSGASDDASSASEESSDISDDSSSGSEAPSGRPALAPSGPAWRV